MRYPHIQKHRGAEVRSLDPALGSCSSFLSPSVALRISSQQSAAFSLQHFPSFLLPLPCAEKVPEAHSPLRSFSFRVVFLSLPPSPLSLSFPCPSLPVTCTSTPSFTPRNGVQRDRQQPPARRRGAARWPRNRPQPMVPARRRRASGASPARRFCMDRPREGREGSEIGAGKPTEGGQSAQRKRGMKRGKVSLVYITPRGPPCEPAFFLSTRLREGAR